MRILLAVGMVVVLACGTSAADDKIDGKKLVGKWEPKEPKKDEKGMVMEFTKDDKLIITGMTPEGKEEKIEGTYKLEGDKLNVELKFGDQTIKETFTITKLTDDEMEGKDKDGKSESFKRVKAKPEK